MLLVMDYEDDHLANSFQLFLLPLIDKNRSSEWLDASGRSHSHEIKQPVQILALFSVNWG